MDKIDAPEAKIHFSRLLARVEHGETLTITRHGKPVAHLIPVNTDRKRSKEAAARIVRRRRHLKRTPLDELMSTIHDGHRY